MKKIFQQAANDPTSNYVVKNGLCFYKQRVVVPPALRDQLLQEFHDSKVAEYWYNTTFLCSTGMTPFQALYGRLPPSIPHYTEGLSRVNDVDQSLLTRDEVLQQLKTNLELSAARMKHVADQKRREVEFQVGDLVLLKLHPYHQQSVFKRAHHKLASRFYGPFPVEQKLGKVAYRLCLPPATQIHPVFHVSLLKKAIARLFDFSAGSKFVGKEIVTCIGMAKDGIHAVLVVFSVRSRFSQEEEAALHSWQTLFGKNVFDYMIVVFTGGDELEDNDETLEDYLGRECPKPLKTKDEAKRTEQIWKLLSLVNSVAVQNDGQPYTDDIFVELKEFCTPESLGTFEILLEQQLTEEQAAPLKVEEAAQLAQMKSNDEIRKLRENLERAQRETEELRKRAEKGGCAIL
ncbi:Immune-associated nucleotide-binding protein 9 [Citrus sinensis]|uniref:Immune-associated nucleotide-binding protein 9 n=1 Tax=Citrus sinensis TaxID=2711 RepID=A0ACB8M5U6_CITSI|nr:Immune-associated nucleotide-binding protein 9 [Citrus sinensis]